MSDPTPVVMGNDEWLLYKRLYSAVEKAQKRGVSIQMVLGHVTALKLHVEYTTLHQIRTDTLPTLADTPNAAERDSSKEQK